jgi:hypothetical protein
MKRLACLVLACVISAAVAGCAFNRSDFVSGANGAPKTDEVSDTGRSVGNFIRTGALQKQVAF